MYPCCVARCCLFLSAACVSGWFSPLWRSSSSNERAHALTSHNFGGRGIGVGGSRGSAFHQGVEDAAASTALPPAQPNAQPNAQPLPITQLFRNRFIVGRDFVVRMPLSAADMLRTFVERHEDMSTGVVQVGVEAFRPLDTVQWCPDASRMVSSGNAGGSSLISEVLAFEVLARAFGASLERTELELSYNPGSTLTDFAIRCFDGHALGVSVTRAVHVTREWCEWSHGADARRRRHLLAELDAQDATRLLEKKLSGINTSSRNVRNYRWRKQILVVWAFSWRDAALLERQFMRLAPSLRANTVLLVARCSGVEWIW